MQALENYEKEIGKAFEKIGKDLEKHKDIFKRLEDDLATVRTFEELDYTDALAEMRRQDSELYSAIRDAYDREQFAGNKDKHIQGVIAAVHAIYGLGYNNGFKAGAEYAQKGTKE